jgi:hypothetical protein
MSTKQLARAIAACVKSYGFTPTVESIPPLGQIYLTMNTTKTRASCVVSRVKLLVDELAQGKKFYVDKVCLESPPKKRDDVRAWQIVVLILKEDHARQSQC